MPTPPTAEAVPSPRVADTPTGLKGRHPAALAVGSGLVLWTTFPPADWGWLAWVALVPLFLLVPSRRPAPALYGAAWAGGFVFWALAISWVRLSDESAWLGWLTMALVLSLFWPAFLAVARLGFHRLRLPLMIAAPVAWVALEYARAYFATGFPWYYLAHSQHAYLPVIQIADFTGSLGVSLLIAVVNAWVVDVLTLPLFRASAQGPRLTAPQAVRLAVAGGLVVSTLGYGAYRLGTARFREGPRVALLQSSLIQRYKDSKTAEELLAVYQNLVTRAASAAERPDLVVWPETSYPYGYITIDPALGAETLAGQVRQLSSDKTFTAARRITQRDLIAAQLHDWTDRVGIPMLVGSLAIDHRTDGVSRYNSALLFEPGKAAVQASYKLHLVPFGEYVPLIEIFPWLTVLTPYRGNHVPSLSFGKEPARFKLGPYRIATAICFEDTVPQVVLRLFRDNADERPPDLLVNLSNDGWFHGSSEHDMHLAVSIFRAIEHRVPLARAANTGISAIVDGNGRVVSSLATLQEGVLSGVVPLDDRSGAYTSWGDWLGQSCLAIVIGLGPLALVYPRWRRARSD